ncbi:aldo/keto reductase [Caldinitratiruptor microaerophilus]|uniref:Aldo/keto reductase n=1 Tax=Caldinitratiruptor microaerophilus TaxID=671077 RepID=A0AA35G8F6_9FIRM|nr:aldo/keto reductase [Caldinitratiruptor microaerophilus]BDG61011.1 aldo/keto reductase [Caldinitratiruptor microaerophilus]
MEYRRLGRSGLKVSVLSVGTMTFGEKVEEPTAIRIIHQALDAGVNVIDTADVYAGGESERIVGRALEGRRDKVVLATKVYMPTGPGPNDRGLSRHHVMQAVEASLRRLGTDYIDLYQVHRFDPEVPVEETLRALDDLVRQGKVRYIGCSNWAAWQIAWALGVSERLGLEPFVSVQPRYNLAHREPERELFPCCLQLGVGVLVYSPIAGGVLTGKYRGGEAPPGSRGYQNPSWQQLRLTPRNLAIAGAVERFAAGLGRPPLEVALNWVLANPAVSTAIVGSSSPEQFAQSLAALEWRLTDEQVAALSRAAEAAAGEAGG